MAEIYGTGAPGAAPDRHTDVRPTGPGAGSERVRGHPERLGGVQAARGAGGAERAAGERSEPLGNPRTTLHPALEATPGPTIRVRLSAQEVIERRLDAAAGVLVGEGTGAALEALLAYQGRRRSRAKLRRVVQGFTALPRLSKCGRTTVTGSGAPVLRVSGTNAGYAGIATCGSVWCCPTCAAKIAAHRAEDLATVMRRVLDAGGSASLMTFTLRHRKGQSLAELWDAISDAWGKVTSGKQWGADQRVGGMLGWVKAVEVTYGHHGWHPHIHVLVCWTSEITLDTAQRVANSMHRRWEAALNRSGLQSWREHGGLDVRMASLDSDNLADYFTKLAREVTSQATKGTRKGRPPFAILTDIGQDFLADDADLWWEWEQASFRRRQLSWSGKELDLRRFAELGQELSDEQAAAEELAGDDVLALTPESWGWLVANEATTDLLDVAEQGGPSAATDWLDARGLDWQPGTAAPPPSLAPPDIRERERIRWRPTLWKHPTPKQRDAGRQNWFPARFDLATFAPV